MSSGPAGDPSEASATDASGDSVSDNASAPEPHVRTYVTASGRAAVKLKDDTVDVQSVPQSVLDEILEAALPSYRKREALDVFVVTSAHDGRHSSGTLHDDGLAIDLRVWEFTEAERRAVCEEMADRLGDSYDVVDETDHIHVEYDVS